MRALMSRVYVRSLETPGVAKHNVSVTVVGPLLGLSMSWLNKSHLIVHFLTFNTCTAMYAHILKCSYTTLLTTSEKLNNNYKIEIIKI